MRGEREPHLGKRKGGSEPKHGEERVDYTVKEGGEGGQAKRVSLEVEGSMSG